MMERVISLCPLLFRRLCQAHYNMKQAQNEAKESQNDTVDGALQHCSAADTTAFQ